MKQRKTTRNLKRNIRKLLSLTLTAMMFVSLLSVSVMAEEKGSSGQEEVVSGEEAEIFPEEAVNFPDEAEADPQEAEETRQAEPDPATEADPVVEAKTDEAPAAGPGEAAAEGTDSMPDEETVTQEAVLPEEKELKDICVTVQDHETAIILAGKMPEDASAEACPVKVEIPGIKILAAYDITIFDAEGCEYQPADGAISVTIQNEAIQEAVGEKNALSVYHMEDKQAEPEKVSCRTGRNGSVKFDAKKFSIYIVGEDDQLYETDGESPHYVYTLHFYLGDTADHKLLSTQTVSPGEKVEAPAVPDQANYEFAGWWSEPDGKGIQYDFYNGVMPEIEGDADQVIDLYAHYVELYYIHYMTHAYKEDEPGVIFHMEACSKDQVLDTTNAEDLYLAEGYLSYIDEQTGALITALAVTGWLDADGTRWDTGDVIDWDAAGGVLTLYPIVEAACWVYFDLNGLDSLENPSPEYVLATERTIGALPEPAVSGYSFEGWYTEADGGSLVTENTALADLPKNTDGSVTLYAHWKAGKAAYTINIWRQKAIDGKAGVDSKEITDGETYDEYIQYYDYAESHYVSADQSELYTGDTPVTGKVYNWNTYTGYATITNENSAYFGFEYGTNTTARTRTLNDLGTITMAADGSTVINIFYNRVTITWTFSRSGSQGGSGIQTGTLIGLYDTNVAPADGVGAGTLSDWPSAGTDYIWEGSFGAYYNEPYTFEAKFKVLNNLASVSFKPYSFSNARKPIYYYLEVTNAAVQVDPDGEKAREAAEYGISYTKTVEGTPYVYTRRLLIQNGLTIESKFVGYEYAGYNITDKGTTFTGTGSSVPTNTSQCFIFNKANNHTITLISNNQVVGVDGAGNAIETTGETTYTVKYGEDLGNYPFPETLDAGIWAPAWYYHFAGWYVDPTYTAVFSTTTMPNYNLAAYADWALNDITVTFVTGTSGVEAPEAQHLLATEKAADPGLLEREGYTHAGWVDQKGKVFNFDTVLYEDTVLRAIWKADDETGYILQYDLNVEHAYGLFDGYTGETTLENAEHFMAEEELWTIEQSFGGLEGTDYEEAYDRFIGWNTAADGTGTMYYPEDEFTLDDSSVINDGVVTLYAVWARRNESTLILDHNYPEGYILQDGETGQDIVTGDNLASIDVESESGLAYHQEIQATDALGEAHTYRFDGWSTTDPGKDPSDQDVDISADAVVAVDTLFTGGSNTNYLFAVWIEVHGITVTKEILNDAVNYEVPSGQSFAFGWSFVDGEGVTNTNAEEILLRDGESFTIPDVATGERVTITETGADGFTTSFTGAHDNVTDTGTGTYSFDMEENSGLITVYNTVDTKTVTVGKIWADGGIDHSRDDVPVTVTVLEDGSPVGDGLILSAENDWQASFKIVRDDSITYTVAESGGPEGYKAEVSGDVDRGFVITNTKLTDIKGSKTWDYGDDPDEKPASITVRLLADGTEIDRKTVTAQDDWTWRFQGLEQYDEGTEVTYSITEDAVPNYTSVVDGYNITNTYTPLMTTVTITKDWKDDHDRDGLRPEEITVTLTGTNGFCQPVILSGAEGWTASVDVPLYHNRGALAEYHVTEDAVEGYDEPVITSEDGYSFTVTNTHEPERINDTGDPDTAGKLTVVKTWEDQDDLLLLRPESIKVQLLADGDPAVDGNGTGILTLCEAEDWTGTFEGLYKYADGKEIEYSVEEAEPVRYYELVRVDKLMHDGIYSLEAVNASDIAFYPLDEEIVPGDDEEETPESWVKRESVNAYDAIEIEMSTTLPAVSGEVLEDGGFGMTFHNRLDTGLMLDMLQEDFTVDIDGTPIDAKYYSIDTTKANRLLTFFNIADDCDFHVEVDLSALYADGWINEGNLGVSTIRIFFHTDLEAEDVNRSYTSTAWYEVTEGDRVLYTSETSVVAVYTFEIIVDKYDTDTGDPLAGAVFGLYYDRECEHAVSRNGEAYQVTTDENGQAMFIGIAEGTYFLKELKAPDGYDLVDEPLMVTLTGADKDENVSFIAHVSFGNTATVPDEETDTGEGETGDDGTGDNEPGDNGTGADGSDREPETGDQAAKGGDQEPEETDDADAPAAGTVKTEDTSMPLMFLLLMAASLAVVICVRRYMRRS